jgi:hypothetical protein
LESNLSSTRYTPTSKGDYSFVVRVPFDDSEVSGGLGLVARPTPSPHRTREIKHQERERQHSGRVEQQRQEARDREAKRIRCASLRNRMRELQETYTKGENGVAVNDSAILGEAEEVYRQFGRNCY